jgi:hypothetical protein
LLVAAGSGGTALECARQRCPRAILVRHGTRLLAITAAARINYAIYGNVDPALHAHIFPRDSAEPESTRTAQPWALDWKAAPLYSDALHGDFKRRVGMELRKHYASR